MAEAYWMPMLASTPGILGLYLPPFHFMTVNSAFLASLRYLSMKLVRSSRLGYSSSILRTDHDQVGMPYDPAL